MAREQRPGDWAAWMGTPAGPRPGAAVVTPSSAPSAPPAVPAAPSDPRPEAESPADGHRSARREATRQRLLDAASEVIAERGVYGTTVEEVCERAGFTRGAFYSNFTDRDDVVGAVMEREHDRLLAHLDSSVAELSPHVAASFDLPEALEALMGGVLSSIPLDRQLSLIQTELEVFAVRRPDLGGRFLEINSRFRDRIATFLDDALRQHGRELVVAPDLLTDAIIAIAERSIRRALLVGDDDPDALSRAILPGLLLAFSRPAPAAS